MKMMSLVKYLFFVIGLGMLVGSFFVYQNTERFLASAQHADGVVVELVASRSSDSTTYAPLVEFETNDGMLVEFLSSSGSNPPSYSEGEVVEVLYLEHSPNEAKINGWFSLWGVTTILGGLGGAFFLVGFTIILSGILKEKKVKYLKENGVKISTKFQSVALNGTLQVNGESPYQIYTQWKNPSTSEIHVFKSENIWFDPTDHIAENEITVFIERDNPNKYHVDISFLPKLSK